MNEFECPTASTVLQAVDWAARKLDGRVESELLLGEVCASSRLELYLDHDRRLDPLESSRFTALVDRRMRGEPVQYLTGRTEFYGRGFEVSPAVLIPRPETERLVDHVRTCLDGMRSERAGNTDVRFADIGTGSGVLAVTLALECPFAQGYATDVSPEALEVARRNADRLLGDRHDRITFMQGSLLAPFDARGPRALDLIVANPPYVASREMDGLPEEVRGYEPRLALHGGKDGLEYHRALIEQAPGYLNAGGVIALEIGAGQSAAVVRLMMERRAYGNVEIVKDYNGLDRIVSAKYVG